MEKRWNKDTVMLFGELVTAKFEIDYIFEGEQSDKNRIDVIFYNLGEKCTEVDYDGHCELNDRSHVDFKGNGKEYIKSNSGALRMYVYDKTDPYSMEEYQRTAAHEFVHILGTYDGYNDNDF